MSSKTFEEDDLKKTAVLAVGAGATLTAVSYYRKAKIGATAATLAGEYLSFSALASGASFMIGLGAAAAGGILIFKGADKLYSVFREDPSPTYTHYCSPTKVKSKKKNSAPIADDSELSRQLVVPDGDGVLEQHGVTHPVFLEIPKIVEERHAYGEGEQIVKEKEDKVVVGEDLLPVSQNSEILALKAENEQLKAKIHENKQKLNRLDTIEVQLIEIKAENYELKLENQELKRMLGKNQDALDRNAKEMGELKELVKKLVGE